MARTICRVILGFLLTGILIEPTGIMAQRPPGPAFRPAPPSRPVVINNNFSNNNTGLDFLSGVVGFGAGLAVSKAVNQPRVPQSSVIITQPAPAVVVTQPHAASVFVTQPVPAFTTLAPKPVLPVDTLGDSLKMLSSHWAVKRREAATKLGRLRASSALGPLMDVLRNDKDVDVRKAAAWALAEIGDTVALDYLEKAAQFDKSPEVRAAARTASQKLVEKVAIRNPVADTSRLDAYKNARRNSEVISPPLPGVSVPTSSERMKAKTMTLPPASSSSSPFGTGNRPSSELPVLGPPG